MKKLTVKEILEHPELAQFIVPQNVALFLLKNKDYNELLMSEVQAVNDIQQQFLDGKLTYDNSRNEDVQFTMKTSSAINNILKENSKKINADKLMLYMGFTAVRTLQTLNKIYMGRPVQGVEELFFENGDYIVINDGDIRAEVGEGKDTTINDLRNKLARIVLISASHFNSNPQKNRKAVTDISGTYFCPGEAQYTEKIRYTEKELLDFARSVELIGFMTNKELSQAILEGLTQKNILLKHIEKGKIDRKVAIDFMHSGVISEDDFIKRVYKKSNFTEVAEDMSVNPMVKLLLFEDGKISLETFKKIADFSLAFNAYAFEKISIDEFQDLIRDKKLEIPELSFQKDWYAVSVGYSHEPKEHVITNISELLTHNIFDYAQSMDYLRYMERAGVIGSEDSKYIEQLMRDFKADELINSKETELVEVTGEGEPKSQHYVPSLTIDPQVRINYLKSLGAVKKLKVKGECFIKDGEENSKKRNSLDGYEMFIIPSKKIAVLEKLYETTRDKAGNIQYRKNKDGELIPAIENATYIMPIEMAKDFIEKKNKQDLIKSPYVERSMHTADWTINTERKIKKIRPEIQFDRENSKMWSDRVRENYIKNKERNERTLE